MDKIKMKRTEEYIWKFSFKAFSPLFFTFDRIHNHAFFMFDFNFEKELIFVCLQIVVALN